MTNVGDINYKKIGDWFNWHTPGLIPKAGMDFSDQEIDKYHPFFEPKATISLTGNRLNGLKTIWR
jgi:hypothetical protein